MQRRKLKKRLLCLAILSVLVVSCCFPVFAFSPSLGTTWQSLGSGGWQAVFINKDNPAYLVLDINALYDLNIGIRTGTNVYDTELVYTLHPGEYVDVCDIFELDDLPAGRSDIFMVTATGSYSNDQVYYYYNTMTPSSFYSGAPMSAATQRHPVEEQEPDPPPVDPDPPEDDDGDADKAGLLAILSDLLDQFESKVTFGLSDVLDWFQSIPAQVITWFKGLWSFPIVGDMLLAFVAGMLILLVFHLFTTL